MHVEGAWMLLEDDDADGSEMRMLRDECRDGDMDIRGGYGICDSNADADTGDADVNYPYILVP